MSPAKQTQTQNNTKKPNSYTQLLPSNDWRAVGFGKPAGGGGGGGCPEYVWGGGGRVAKDR